MVAMAMAMMAALAAFLHVAHFLTWATPQGDTGDALGHQTPPPSKDKGQCPPALKKHTEEEGDKPAHLTTEEWAVLNVAEEHKYTMAFQRYIC
jgi:hypothetical protein